MAREMEEVKWWERESEREREREREREKRLVDKIYQH